MQLKGKLYQILNQSKQELSRVQASFLDYRKNLCTVCTPYLFAGIFDSKLWVCLIYETIAFRLGHLTGCSCANPDFSPIPASSASLGLVAPYT